MRKQRQSLGTHAARVRGVATSFVDKKTAREPRALPGSVTRWLAVTFFLTASIFYLSCSTDTTGVRLFTGESFPEKLSEWRLFQVENATLKPNARVVPYDLNTPLFSDYASKHRHVWMPAGTSAVYHDEEAFEFPVGTIISKTFAFPKENDPSKETLIETRLLVHTQAGWKALPYLWNDAQTEATLALTGNTLEVKAKDDSGKFHQISYGIPNVNECAQCHERSKALLPIGPKARNLNRDFQYADGKANQLAYWTKIGYLKGAPAPEQAPKLAVWNDPSTGSIEARARAYLENNCAHCHQSGGSAGYTAFWLGSKINDPRNLGYCKNPNSAGYSGNLAYDIVPGKPDQSILLYRMLSNRPKEMMPEIGRGIVHQEGVALVRQWLAELKGSCAEETAQLQSPPKPAR